MFEKSRWMLPALGVLLAGVVLYFCEPGRGGFSIYPVCQFHKWTGWHCPACGSLRALHELTHGNVAGAIGLNPLVVVIGPLFLLGWAWHRRVKSRGRPACGLLGKPPWGWIVAGVAVAYTVLRNLPFEPFSRMAP